MTREVRFRDGQVFDYLQYLRKKREWQYAGCSIWSLLSVEGERKGIRKLQVVFCDDTSLAQVKDGRREYPSHRFVVEKRSVPEGFSTVEKLVQGGTITVGGEDIEVSASNLRIEEWDGLEAPIRLGWPAVSIDFGLAKGGANYYGGPFIALDQPAIPSEHHAEKDWFPVPFGGDPHPCLKQDFGIVLPDYRAKLRRATLDQNSVEIEIDCQRLSLDKLVGKYYFVVKGEAKYGNIEVRGGKGLIDVEGYPDELYIYLIEDPSGDVVDRLEYCASWSYAPPGVVIKASAQQLRYLIDGGENEWVEFKQEFPAGSKKEFLESVVAFANGQGGRILVGVTNNCEVIGIHEADLESKISNIISDKCEPNPKCSFQRVPIEDKEVLIVFVEEGDNKPYMLEGTVYIRAGSNDRPAKRSEVDYMYARSASGNLKVGW